MNKKTIWLSALALSMSLSQATLACDCEMPSSPKDRLVRMTEKLDLTAEQKNQIKAISEKAREEMKPKYEQMHANRMQLNELAAAKDVDQTKVDKLIDENKEILGSIMKMRVMVRHDIDMVLNDKQKEKLNKMVSEWKEKHMKKD